MAQRTGPRGAAIYQDSRNPEAALLRGVEAGFDSHGKVRCRVDPGLGEDERRRLAEALAELLPRLAAGGRHATH